MRNNDNRFVFRPRKAGVILRRPAISSEKSINVSSLSPNNNNNGNQKRSLDDIAADQGEEHVEASEKKQKIHDESILNIMSNIDDEAEKINHGLTDSGLVKTVDKGFHFKISSKVMYDKSNASAARKMLDDADIRDLEAVEKLKATSKPSHKIAPPGLSRLSMANVKEYSILLPSGDSPIIDKTKLISTKEGDGARKRRSSIGLRGKRVSQSNTGVIFAPHEDISSSSFYRHIDAEMSDPNRFAQLLSWCGQHLLAKEMDKSENNSNSNISTNNKTDTFVESDNPKKKEFILNLTLQKIKKEFVNSLGNKTISVSWYNRDSILEDDESSKRAIKEDSIIQHPQNIENRTLLESYSQNVERLQEEEKQWMKLIDTHNAQTLSNAKKYSADTVPIIDDVTKVLIEHDLDEDGKKILQEYCNDEENSLKQLQKWVREKSDNLRYDVSNLENIMHKASSLDFRTSRFVENVFTKLLEEHKRRVEQNKVDPIKALHMLSASSANN